MNRRPTLTLPPGTPIQVYLNQDLVLERPYLAAR
jgi:type IV secretory pathway VirB10-like protein